ncbi:MAG: DMT family transporter [Bacteroidota bacterium]|nr:DMT family transporter [Bacteroidota bacterium]
MSCHPDLPSRANYLLLIAFLTSIAVILRILSSPLANVYQKKLAANGHHPLTINFRTYLLLAAVCLLPALGVQWMALPRAFWLYSVMAGIVGAVGNGFLVKALQKGDLSVLGPVNSYKSVVGIVFGVFLLNEVPTIWGLLGVALIIYGSYFVLDTTAEGFSWQLLKRREIQYRLWAMILTAVEAVFIKKIILASSATIAFISWCWFGAFFSFFLLETNRRRAGEAAINRGRGDASRYVLLVMCIGIMQLTTNYVFDHMPVGYALSLFQLSTLVSVLLGYRIFKEQDVRKKLIGSAIMIAGSVMIILLKER